MPCLQKVSLEAVLALGRDLAAVRQRAWDQVDACAREHPRLNDVRARWVLQLEAAKGTLVVVFTPLQETQGACDVPTWQNRKGVVHQGLRSAPQLEVRVPAYLAGQGTRLVDEESDLGAWHKALIEVVFVERPEPRREAMLTLLIEESRVADLLAQGSQGRIRVSFASQVLLEGLVDVGRPTYCGKLVHVFGVVRL
jgi:hypothetical protein